MHVHAYYQVLLLLLVPCVSASRVRGVGGMGRDGDDFIPREGVLRRAVGHAVGTRPSARILEPVRIGPETMSAGFRMPAESPQMTAPSAVLLPDEQPPTDGLPRTDKQSVTTGRREFMTALASLGLALPFVATPVSAAEPSVKMYFGAGCFWHVQHEFALEEMALGRNTTSISAVTGYAGGTKVGSNNRVCYHNPLFLADYGSLGHTEVVQVDVPESSLPAFSKRYFSLFGNRGYRHDPGDQGPEYRSVLGLPGGFDSPLFSVVKEAAAQSPMKLVRGSGDEPDTFNSKQVFVMDSNKFPFYPAEVYHQFHNDFIDPPYGKAYNKIQQMAVNDGRIANTGCPEVPF